MSAGEMVNTIHNAWNGEDFVPSYAAVVAAVHQRDEQIRAEERAKLAALEASHARLVEAMSGVNPEGACCFWCGGVRELRGNCGDFVHNNTCALADARKVVGK